MTATDAYAELVRRSKELGVLNPCAAMLAWDQQTYMPAKGAGLRGEQMAFLAALSHQKFTDPKVGELLAAVEASDLVKQPDSDAAANVRELRRAYNRATKCRSRSSRNSRVTTQVAGRSRRRRRTTSRVPPWLEKVVGWRQKRTRSGSRTTATTAHGEYEPGRRSRTRSCSQG